MKALIVFVIVMLSASCAGLKTKDIRSDVTKQREVTDKSRDSVSSAVISKAINDAIITAIPSSKTSDQAFNKAVDAAVDEILQKLNVQKQSGDNSYHLFYDLIKRELQFRAQVGETKSESSQVNTSVKTEKSFEQKTDEYISKKLSSIPWWLYVVAILWFLPQILDRAKMIVNPVSMIFKK